MDSPEGLGRPPSAKRMRLASSSDPSAKLGNARGRARARGTALQKAIPALGAMELAHQRLSLARAHQFSVNILREA
jgi:hypothetical protein